MKETVAEPVPVVVEAQQEAVLLEQTQAQVEVAPIHEEAPVAETPPVKPSVVEDAVVQEVETIAPETEPELEVRWLFYFFRQKNITRFCFAYILRER